MIYFIHFIWNYDKVSGGICKFKLQLYNVGIKCVSTYTSRRNEMLRFTFGFGIPNID